MLIDQSYFVGEINIPNTDDPIVLENLQIFINKYETKFLKTILGATLYAAYIAATTIPVDPATDPVTYQAPAQQWVNLQNQLRDPVAKTSPIANYIYFFFIRDGALYNSGVGSAQSAEENATVTDGKSKSMRAWNEMNCWCYEIYCFIKNDPTDYGVLPYTAYFPIWPVFLDWDGWYWGFGYFYRDLIPEIFRPVNYLNL